MKIIFIFLAACVLMLGTAAATYMLAMTEKKNGRSDDAPETKECEKISEAYVRGIKQCTYCELVTENARSGAELPKSELCVFENMPSRGLVDDIGEVLEKLYSAGKAGCSPRAKLVIMERHGEALNYFVIPVETGGKTDIYSSVYDNYGILPVLSHRFIFSGAFYDSSDMLHFSVEETGLPVSGYPKRITDVTLTRSKPVIVCDSGKSGGRIFSGDAVSLVEDPNRRRAYTCCILVNC